MAGTPHACHYLLTAIMPAISIINLLRKRGKKTVVNNDNVGTYAFQAASAPATFAPNTLSPMDFNNGLGFKFSSPKGASLKPSNLNDFVLQTKYSSRDAEISTYVDKAWVLLRISNNRAIYFNRNGNVFSCGVCLNVNDLAYSTAPGAVGNNAIAYYTIEQDISAALSQTGDNSGLFTFGCSGAEVYAKYNGIEFYRTQQYDHLVAGSVGVKVMTTDGYVTGVNVQHKTRAFTYSDTDNLIIDVRDFGAKPLQTTGSMSAGSNQIAVADASGIPVGSQIIVEIGGEAPSNGFQPATRGALGVNGNWPARHYPNEAALQADTSQPLNVIAWVEDTRLTYENFGIDGGGWFKKQYFSTVGVQQHEENYYINKALPISLRAIVMEVNGNVLTLDTPCVNATTNANVYFDNIDIFNWFTRQDTSGQKSALNTTITLFIPAGTFAVSEAWDFANCPDWTLQGAGKEVTVIKSPKGTPSAFIDIVSSPNIKCYDFTLQGCGTSDGYGFVWWNAPANSGDDYTTSMDYNTFDTHEKNRGLHINSACPNAHVKNVKIIDCFTSAIEISATDCLIEYCDVVHTTGVHYYMAWMVVSSGASARNTFDHITFTSPKQIGAFEAFGAPDVTFSNITSVNGTFSCNSADNTKYLNWNMLFTPDSLPDWMAADNFPAGNLNGNAYPGNQPKGAIVDSVTITNQGYIDSGNNLKRGIVIQDLFSNATVRNCSYIVDNSIKDLSTTQAMGFMSTGTNTTFDSCTCVGHNIQSDYAPNQAAANANIYCSNGIVESCVCDTLLIENTVVYSANTVNKHFNINP
jgi:hypothetical protein